MFCRSHIYIIIAITMPDMKIGEVVVNTTDVSEENLRKLKQLLPDLQHSGEISDLEIVEETIHYIKELQEKLALMG